MRGPKRVPRRVRDASAMPHSTFQECKLFQFREMPDRIVF
jgi:hypothetical protein